LGILWEQRRFLYRHGRDYCKWDEIDDYTLKDVALEILIEYGDESDSNLIEILESEFR